MAGFTQKASNVHEGLSKLDWDKRGETALAQLPKTFLN